MDKRVRHRVIARILENGDVPNQETLRARLLHEGIDTTQGTLSRDLHEMGVMKGPRGYALYAHEQGGGTDVLRQVLRSLLVSAEPASTMVVLKTEPGNAGSVAVQIDSAALPGIAGCIAGDDTVFLATYSTRQARDLARVLLTMSGFSENGTQ